MSRLPPVDHPLDESEAEAAFSAMFDGDLPDEAIADFLVALSDRGETAAEIAGAARAMRARMIPINAPANAIDVCGTGGDGHHTLNVSTAGALVAPARGGAGAQPRNRARTSKGAAARTPRRPGPGPNPRAEKDRENDGAPGPSPPCAVTRRPAGGRIMPIRKKLARRTIFNLMGPLANPARVRRQLVGIARPAYVPIYAEALARLGTERSFVVSGDEGLDELSLAGGNELAEVVDGEVRMKRVDAAEAGLPHAPIEALRGGDPQHNAAELHKLLLGETGPYRDAVLFNAAGALLMAGEVETWAEGAEEAAEAIDKGLAKALLDCWIAHAK